jgi:hypothetical protein
MISKFCHMNSSDTTVVASFQGMLSQLITSNQITTPLVFGSSPTEQYCCKASLSLDTFLYNIVTDLPHSPPLLAHSRALESKQHAKHKALRHGTVSTRPSCFTRGLYVIHPPFHLLLDSHRTLFNQLRQRHFAGVLIDIVVVVAQD